MLTWQSESIRANPAFLKNGSVPMEAIKGIFQCFQGVSIEDIASGNIAKFKKCTEALYYFRRDMALDCWQINLPKGN
jgi:hypothetical protein